MVKIVTTASVSGMNRESNHDHLFDLVLLLLHQCCYSLMTNAIVVVAADALAVPALLLLCLLVDLLLLKDIIILVAFGFFRFLIDDKEREKGERILVLFVARSDNIPMTFHT